MTEQNHNEESSLKEAPLASLAVADRDIDLSLLKDSLAKTPWERMQANDDALNFAESLRGAMEMRNAKPK
ncbi:MAG: hypothetical protein ACLQAH_01160 [Limisphaerales bacterium]